MNKHSYGSNLTDEDIRNAERKYPLAHISTLKMVIPLLVITVIMFMLGVFIL